MQLPFTLPTDNYLLIGGAILGFILFAAAAYFLFFKKSAPSTYSSEAAAELPVKVPESFENMDAAGDDDAEGYEQPS
jgi:hypothetical protein